MKSIVPVLCCISLLGLPASAAANKNPYYRHGGPRDVVPRQNGGDIVVNAASFEPGVSPGELATIFGRDLTSVSGIVMAPALPLPTHLDGVTVVVDGIVAPIYSIAFANGEDQISFQVPFETPTGPGAAEILVFDSGVQTADFFADSFTEDPGIFVYNGNLAVAVHPSHWTLVNPSNPAAPGEIVVLYTTGMGPVDRDVPDGFPGPANPPAFTIDPFQVILNGENCAVLFSGLAPGFAGLYQLNFRVPFDSPPGNLELQIESPYASSRVAALWVE